MHLIPQAVDLVWVDIWELWLKVKSVFLQLTAILLVEWGDTEALIYLASPEVAAASAIAGYIANPKK